MVPGTFGKPTVAEIVLCGRMLPVVRLERAHEVFRVIRPEAGLFCVVLKILLKGFVTFARHGQVAGKNIVKRRNVSGALDRSVTAQRENSTAGPANVAEKKLQDRSRTNDLHSLGMLRPTHGVTN